MTTIFEYAAGVTTILSLLSFLGALYVWLQSQKKERSLVDTIKGEGIVEAQIVVKILKQFKSDESRLDALQHMLHYSQDRATDVLDKVKPNIDVGKFSLAGQEQIHRRLRTTGIFFTVLAVLSIVGSRSSLVPPDTGQPKALLLGRLEYADHSPADGFVVRNAQGSRITDKNGDFALPLAGGDIQNGELELSVNSITSKYAEKVAVDVNPSALKARIPVLLKIHPPMTVWNDPTGSLTWTAKDSGDYLNWDEARAYCSTTPFAGLEGWRLPTIGELERIHDVSHRYQFTWRNPPCCGVRDGDTGIIYIKEGIELDSCCAWSSDRKGGANPEASYFRFQSNPPNGEHVATVDAGMVGLMRALCVRSDKIAPASAPTATSQVSGSASTTGDNSPAITGNGNTIQYDQSSHPAKKQEPPKKD